MGDPDKITTVQSEIDQVKDIMVANSEAGGMGDEMQEGDGLQADVDLAADGVDGGVILGEVQDEFGQEEDEDEAADVRQQGGNKNAAAEEDAETSEEEEEEEEEQGPVDQPPAAAVEESGSEEEEGGGEEAPVDQPPANKSKRYRSRSLDDAFTQGDGGMYSCNLCQKEVTSKNKRSHKTRHTEGKNFPCTRCGRRYRSKASLVDHFEVHHGNVHFRCDTCNKKLLSFRAQRAHEKKFHPENE